MRNLDKVWQIWSDLDKSYDETKGTKKEYLCSLIASGNADKVRAILAKIANDIVSAEDNKMYATIQASMLALLNNYDNLSDNISSLTGYVTSLAEAGNGKVALSFEDLMELISFGKSYVVPSVEWDSSPVGMELITADSIHKVKLVSNCAVTVPAWLSNIRQLPLSDSEFHRKVGNDFEQFVMKKPFLVLDASKAQAKETTNKNGEQTFLECGDVRVEVLFA